MFRGAPGTGGQARARLERGKDRLQGSYAIGNVHQPELADRSVEAGEWDGELSLVCDGLKCGIGDAAFGGQGCRAGNHRLGDIYAEHVAFHPDTLRHLKEGIADAPGEIKRPGPRPDCCKLHEAQRNRVGFGLRVKRACTLLPPKLRSRLPELALLVTDLIWVEVRSSHCHVPVQHPTYIPGSGHECQRIPRAQLNDFGTAS